MKEEIWKDIVGYEGLYQISNLGRIKRILFINNKVTCKKEHIISQQINKKNRCYASLYKNNKRKNCIVHRLVATAFIPNPNDLPQINHIDGNPRNNNINNLEWCTASYNNKHAYVNELNNLKAYNNKRKKIIIRSDGKEYDCVYSASIDMEVSPCSIRDCLKKRIKTCKGYSFKYKTEWGSDNNAQAN